MRKIVFYLILSATVVLLISAKLIFFPGQQPEKGRDRGGRSAGVLSTVYVVATKELSAEAEVLGSVLPSEQTEIRPEMSGRVEQVLFTEGSRVTSGQTLVKLADQDIKAQIKKLQIQQQFAAEKVKKQQELLNRKLTSQEDFDLVQNQLDLINADLDILNLQLAKTVIKAPFSGEIGFKNVSHGALVSTGTILTTLVQTAPAKIEFALPARYQGLVKAGTNTRISTESGGKILKAAVAVVAPSADGTTRTLTARAVYGNSGNELRPGLSVKVAVQLEKIPDAILVPQQAVIPAIDGQKVFVLEQGKAKERRVTLGLRTAAEVQILSGLNPGDTLLTAVNQLKDGVSVRVKKDKKASAQKQEKSKKAIEAGH